jgi:thiamine-phosphate pyrophosphorylase
MQKYISNLHYLTQDLPHRSHAEQARIACEAGANWVQYRCLTKTTEEMLEEIGTIAAICDDWGATLIVTDHIHLAGLADIQGFHIEDMQADFSSIRQQTGPDLTLGASANTFDDILRIAASGAIDYIGCGPFAITRTKPNDYPVLGTAGYQTIITQMKAEGIHIPLLAVGGIAIPDIDALLQTGIDGIAVSAAVNLSDDPGRAMKEIYRKVY